MKTFYFILLFLMLIVGNVLAGDYYSTPTGDYSDFQGNTLREAPSGNLRDTKTGQYYCKTPSGDYSNFKGDTLRRTPSGNLRKSNWK